LFANDTKASALRGKQRLQNLEIYLDENPDLSFIIYRNYSCEDYCRNYENSFQRLPVPNIDQNILRSISAYFFVLCQDGEEATVESESINITSNELREAANVMASLCPESMGDWSNLSQLNAPYSKVYHSRDILAQYITSENTIIASHLKDQLKALFDYVSREYGQSWLNAEALFQKGLVSRAHLSKLFGPNEIVVTISNRQPMAYRCETAQPTSKQSLTLKCLSWGFDGHFFQEKRQFPLSWISGEEEIPITELQTFPLKYDPSLKGRLFTRGKQFWQCRFRKYVAYTPKKDGLEVHVTNARYMIDTETYNLMHKSMSQQPDELGHEAMQRDQAPDNTFLLLLPQVISGYGLHDKKWRTLNVEDIREIDWNEHAFERRLVLKHEKKDLIKALIMVHTRNDNQKTSDIIEGKGNGLIILLHGGPGTGKTLTAETIAEHVKKPLYRVTCGDIGTDPEAVEKYLESVLCKWRR
jgi:uncharacterized protein DUF7025/ATPase family protein associated with various cellular activities (AAA)